MVGEKFCKVFLIDQDPIINLKVWELKQKQ